MYGAVDICVVFLQLDSLSEVRVLNISGKFHYFFFFHFSLSYRENRGSLFVFCFFSFSKFLALAALSQCMEQMAFKLLKLFLRNVFRNADLVKKTKQVFTWFS